jgi:hypothetical protein
VTRFQKLMTIRTKNKGQEEKSRTVHNLPLKVTKLLQRNENAEEVGLSSYHRGSISCVTTCINYF